jgi:nitrosocyanin
MNNKYISIIVVLVLIAGAFLLFKDKSVAPEIEESNNSATTTESIEESALPDTAGPQVKEFNFVTGQFSFNPKTITVKEGDTVKITVKNTAGIHDLKIDEFNAATPIIPAGESRTVEFVADKKGSFEYYCSVGNHRAMGMVGTLVVE